jgi:hypothetical protein
VIRIAYKIAGEKAALERAQEKKAITEENLEEFAKSFLKHLDSEES